MSSQPQGVFCFGHKIKHQHGEFVWLVLGTQVSQAAHEGPFIILTESLFVGGDLGLDIHGCDKGPQRG